MSMKKKEASELAQAVSAGGLLSGTTLPSYGFSTQHSGFSEAKTHISTFLPSGEMPLAFNAALVFRLQVLLLCLQFSLRHIEIRRQCCSHRSHVEEAQTLRAIIFFSLSSWSIASLIRLCK